MFDINRPCTFCEQKAIYYVLDILSGTKKEWFLCTPCMEKYDKSGYLKLFALSLSGSPVMPIYNQYKSPSIEPIDVRCPKCGMTLSQFMHTKRVGCDNDYDLFKLGPILKEYHKSDQHLGKFPKDQGLTPEVINNRLDNLKSAMEEAISAEKYEDAARLRDEIKILKKDLK
jgi:protein arginine kinase activator